MRSRPFPAARPLAVAGMFAAALLFGAPRHAWAQG